MTETQNTKVIQDAYAAFARGDVTALLGTFDDKIIWKPVQGAADYVPQHGDRHGKAAVREFFELLPQTLTFQQFEPREYVAQGDKVVALGHYRATTPGGGMFDSDFVMVFTLRNGKITSFQEFSDSAQINAAYQPTHAKV
jgi:uncharacterized protein